MAKAKTITPQSKPAAAAKKNVKAKQAAVKAETKKAVPKKVGVALLVCAPSVYMPLVSWLTRVSVTCRLRPAAAKRNPATRMTPQ